MQALLKNILVEDERVVKAFRRHSAAKSVHHSFIGGLLEHTVSVTKLCDFYSKLYPFLNRDLLLSAAMLHDIGKLWEISDFPANDYTDDGQLLGHIVMGYELIGKRIQTIPDFPKKIACCAAHPCRGRGPRVPSPDVRGMHRPDISPSRAMPRPPSFRSG